MVSLGIVFDRFINSSEKEQFSKFAEEYTSGFVYDEIAHWHADKFTAVLMSVEDDDIDTVVEQVQGFSFCDGVFIAADDANPLDPVTRKDLYGRTGTFFGNQVDCDDFDVRGPDIG